MTEIATGTAGPRRAVLGATTRANLRSARMLWLLAVVASVVAALTLPAFRTPTSLNSLMASMGPLLIVATGQAIVILAAGIDLSVGAVLGLATVILAAPQHFGNSTMLAVLALLVGGIVVGLGNGAGVLAGVNPLIMTLATGGIVQGVGLLLLTEPGGAVPDAVTDVVAAQLGWVPVTFVAALVLLVVVWAATSQTRWGRVLLAAGFSPDNARRVGLPWRRATLIAYAAAGLLAALAGLAVIARTYSGDALAGGPFVLDSVTAVLVAGIALTGGRGSVLAVFPAALLLAVVDQVITLTGTDTNYQFILKGLILIVAMWVYQAAGARPALPRIFRSAQVRQEQP